MKKQATQKNLIPFPRGSKYPQKTVWGYAFPEFNQEIEKTAHSHPTGILTGVMTGLVTLRTPEGDWILPPKTVAYLPPGVTHSTIIGNGYSGWVLSLPKDKIAFLPKKICFLEVSDLLLAIAMKIVTKDKNRISRPQKNLVPVLIDELKGARNAPFLQIPMPHNESLRKIASFMLNNPSDMSDIETLTKTFFISRRSFTRHFREETGLTFIDWRQRVKVSAALEKMALGASVTEVSFELGYQNVSAFIAVFRKHLGLSPKEYMRNKMFPSKD